MSSVLLITVHKQTKRVACTIFSPRQIFQILADLIVLMIDLDHVSQSLNMFIVII
jgi:hypothetical protein